MSKSDVEMGIEIGWLESSLAAKVPLTTCNHCNCLRFGNFYYERVVSSQQSLLKLSGNRFQKVVRNLPPIFTT